MSVWAEIWAYNQTAGSPGAKFTLLCLASFADETGFCYPSQESLAAMTEQGISTVRRQLADLQKKKKLIKRSHRYQKGGGRTSDGFQLLGPAEAFRPNRAVRSKSIPLKSSKHTAQIEQSVSNHSAQIEQGSIKKEEGDLSVDLSETAAPSTKPQKSTPYPARKDWPKHVAIYFAVTNRAPAQPVWPLIAQRMGPEPNIERLRECYVTWLDRGFKEFNNGWLDWYTNGIPERKGGQRSAPARQEEDLDYLKGANE